MNTVFKYSLLKYVHSDLLNEQIVIGILFLFPDQGKIIFSHPKSLRRIHGLYKDLHENQIQSFFHAFWNRSYELNKQLNEDLETGNLEDLIKNNYLIRDSVALRFSDVLSGFDPHNRQPDDIVKEYEKLYLKEYTYHENQADKHNEAYISNKIKKLITTKRPEFGKYLQSGYEVARPDKKAQLKIDFWWQNGFSHLVKPISFDLSEGTSINHKAIFHQGTISYLEKYAIENNLHFDLLVAKPQSHKPEVIEAYQTALEILKDIQAPHSIYTENRFESYSEEAIKEIEKHIS